MRAFLALATFFPAAAHAQAQPGWGNVGQQEPQGFSWTRPLFDGFWMAWTPATLDTMQIGYGQVTSNTNTRRVSAVWALVEFVPGTPTSLPPPIALVNRAALNRAHYW